MSTYGSASHWSDQYYSRDKLTQFGGIPTGPFTESLLDHAYNVDVTTLDPSKHGGTMFRSSQTGEMESCFKTSTSHGWPITFYLNTINEPSDVAHQGFGFPLSKEGGKWGERSVYPKGNKTPRILGTPDPSCITDVRIAPPPPVLRAINFLSSPVVDSPTGAIERWISSLKLTTGSPVWTSTITSVSNAVNTVSFDPRFSVGSGGGGLLSILWDDQVIGTIDERSEMTNRVYFRFPNASANSCHVLGFRLESFLASQSVVTVTNVVFYQLGVSRPITLKVDLDIPGSIQQTLVGDSGFEYGIQYSTNLLDWTQIGTVLNSTGSVRFVLPVENGLPASFFRAVAPF